MKIHELKMKLEYAAGVFGGAKRFELRKNDRDYQVGDLVRFKLINDIGDINDFRFCFLKEVEDNIYKITYVLKDVEEYGLDKDYCIFGFVKLVDENRY